MTSNLSQLVLAQGMKYAYLYPGSKFLLNGDLYQIERFWEPNKGRINATVSRVKKQISDKQIFLYFDTFDSKTLTMKYAFKENHPVAYGGDILFCSEASQAILQAYQLFHIDIFEKFMKFEEFSECVSPEKKLDRFLCAFSCNDQYLKNVIHTDYKTGFEDKCDKCKLNMPHEKYHSCGWGGSSFCHVVTAVLINTSKISCDGDCIIMISADREYPVLIIIRPESIEIDGIGNEICYLPLSRLLVWKMLLYYTCLRDAFDKYFRNKLIDDLYENNFIGYKGMESINDILSAYKTQVCLCCAKVVRYNYNGDENFEPGCKCGYHDYDYHVQMMLMGILKNGWRGDEYSGYTTINDRKFEDKLKLTEGDRVHFRSASHGGNICWAVTIFLDKMKRCIKMEEGGGSVDSDSDDSDSM